MIEVEDVFFQIVGASLMVSIIPIVDSERSVEAV